MQFCHTLREFALEYRTCRDRVLQQQQKRATYRERNKTRGRMITEVRAPFQVLPTTHSFSLVLTILLSLFRQRSSRVWLGRPPVTCLSQWLWVVGQAGAMPTVMPV